MFDWLKNLITPTSSPAIALARPAHAEQATNSHLEVYGGPAAGDLALTRYPPFDKGIPLVDIDTLLKSQADLIIRIFRTAGVSREEFNERYDPPIRNLARYIHLLPATSITYFRGTGGLFRMSLEVALNSLQSANGAIFPISGGVERRYFIQPKWSLAAFLAGLCSQNYRTLNSMVVISRDNAQWAPLINPLFDWASTTNIERYHVRWLEDSPVHGAKASAAYSINHIVPPDVLQYLASDNHQIIQSMTAAIAGVETNASENPVTRIVAPIITRVIEEDLKRSATNYGHLVIGAHLEPHLVDAMRRLVRDGKWIPNQPGGRVWIGREGIFIDWLDAASDISQLLSRDAFAGVPKDPDTLASLLANAGLLEMHKPGEPYWTIALPVTLEALDTTVKLRQCASIFPQQFDFSPYQNVQLTLNPKPEPLPKVVPAKVRDLTQTSRAEPKPAITEKETRKGRDEPPPAGLFDHQTEHSPPADTPSLRAPAQATTPPDPPRTEVPRPHLELTHTPKPVRPLAEPAQSAARKEKSAEPASPIEGSEASPADRLLASLQTENAFLLRQVIEGYQNDKTSDRITFLPQGVGIAHHALASHGKNIIEFIEELSSKQWFWVDKTKPGRKIHRVDIEGVTHRLVILKPPIAHGLGLIPAKSLLAIGVDVVQDVASIA